MGYPPTGIVRGAVTVGAFFLGIVAQISTSAAQTMSEQDAYEIARYTYVYAYPLIGNAMLGYEARTWGVTLNVNNITDERYFIAANSAGAFVGDPLSAFVNVHFKQ